MENDVDPTQNALDEGPKGDEITNMLREGLQEHQKATDETRAALDGQPPTPEEPPVEGAPPADEQPTEPTEGPSIQSILEENARLKQKLGKQGNEVGTLREQLSNLGETLDQLAGKTPRPQAPDPRQAVFANLTEKYGEEFANDIVGAFNAVQADIRSQMLVGNFREQIPDFKEYEPEMAEVLQENPALSQAVAQNPNLLTVVYQAARGRKMETVVQRVTSQGQALATKVAADKKAAFVERPGGGQNKEPVKISQKEMGNKILDGIMESRQDGRRL